MFRHLLFAHYYDNFITFEDTEVEKALIKLYDYDKDNKLNMSEILNITSITDRTYFLKIDKPFDLCEI